MFRISALPSALFADLFACDDDELVRRGARRLVADKKPGFPCRVSLADAEPGETVMLVHYEHQSADTPFRSSHAVYVREGASRSVPASGEVPDQLRTRTLSLRGFDADDMLAAADLADGTALETALKTMFADPAVAYVHLHYAKQGCYAARADRAG